MPPDDRPAEADLTARLEEDLLGSAAAFTAQEVSDAAGVDLAFARRLWRSLGFPQAPDASTVYTDSDIGALQLAGHLVQTGLVDPRGAETFTRVLGRGLSHLAEAQVVLLGEHLASREVPLGAAELVQELGRLEDELPGLEQLMVYTWRRHLFAALQRAVTAGDEPGTAAALAVGFADIVDYTRFTRDMSPADLDLLVEDFEARVYDAIVGSGARVVKTLGDEVMFVTESPATAAEVGLLLAEAFADRSGPVPPVRVGLAWGPALARGGDVFGAVVNVAARCCSLARPGAVLVDREFTQALGSDGRFDLHVLRPRAVRGYGHLVTAALRRPRAVRPHDSGAGESSDRSGASRPER